MTGILDWLVKVDEVGPDGYRGEREARADERARLVDELELLAIDPVRVALSIRALSGGRYQLTGRIDTQVTQSCVVTLDPMVSPAGDEMDVELWPAEEIGPLAEGEHSVLEADTPEPIENGRIDLGRIIYEHMAGSIDPYPRKPDADFEALKPTGPGFDKPESPFAVLARLKTPKP
jgi:uncharacterized metal-binding protein YceD (DUF177 family)